MSSEISFKCKVGEETFSLQLSSTSSIADAKAALVSITGSALQNCSQKWIYQGKILKDEDTLADCGIRDDHCVHVMKLPSAGQSSITTSSTTVPPNPRATFATGGGTAATSPLLTSAPVVAFQQHVPVPLFDRGMHMLLGNEEGVAKDAVAMLLKIIMNIVNHPMEEKYRKVKSSSATFNAKIGSISGGLNCLQAIGFQLIGEDWVLVPSADAWPILLACQAKLDRFMIKYLEVCASASSSTAHPTEAPSNTTATSGGAKSSVSEEEASKALEQLMLAMAMVQPSTSSQGGGLAASTGDVEDTTDHGHKHSLEEDK